MSRFFCILVHLMHSNPQGQVCAGCPPTESHTAKPKGGGGYSLISGRDMPSPRCRRMPKPTTSGRSTEARRPPASCNATQRPARGPCEPGLAPILTLRHSAAPAALGAPPLKKPPATPDPGSHVSARGRIRPWRCYATGAPGVGRKVGLVHRWDVAEHDEPRSAEAWRGGGAAWWSKPGWRVRPRAGTPSLIWWSSQCCHLWDIE